MKKEEGNAGEQDKTESVQERYHPIVSTSLRAHMNLAGKGLKLKGSGVWESVGSVLISKESH